MTHIRIIVSLKFRACRQQQHINVVIFISVMKIKLFGIFEEFEEIKQ